MFTLILVLLVVTVSLAVFLFVGTLYLQGYVYTEPSQGLAWQAPAAGAVLGLFLTAWCLSVVYADSSTTDIPYDAFHRFSPRVDMFDTEAKELWAVTKDGKKVRYVGRKDVPFPGRSVILYEDRTYSPPRPWKSAGVEAIILEQKDGQIRFDLVPTSEGGYRQFVSADGWVMYEYDSGPSGIPSRFRWGRFVANLFLNGFHFVLWFLCLWLLLRFQWPHALGLAVVLWIVMTLIVLPMLLDYAAAVSQARRAPTTPVPPVAMQSPV